VADVDIKGTRKRKVKYKPRIRVWKLKKEEHAAEFQRHLSEQSEAVSSKAGPDERWVGMKEAWLGAADKVCGWTKGPPRHKQTWWWTDEVGEVVKEKRVRYTRWKRSGLEEDRRKYLESKRLARNAVWRAQEDKRQELTRELHSEEGKRSIFRVAKQMSKGQTDVEGACCMKSEQGNIVTDSDGIKDIWSSYMEKLLNVENDWDQETTADCIQGPRGQVTQEEVKQALKSTALGKAGGPSGVVTELLAAGGDQSVEWLTVLFNEVINTGAIPTDWCKSILVPLYKGKGDPLTCGSYRAIKLLEQAMKVFERVLERRIRKQVSIDEMQYGFMPGKGTTDAIFIVRQLQEKHRAKKKHLYYAFVDLEKAFDRVPREVVRWALRKSGVEEWLVETVMALFKDASTVVRTPRGDSKEFEVKVGVHQGSVLSPLLFALVMDVVSREAREGLPWELLYADDLVLIATSEEELKRKLHAWRRCLTTKGLKVNSGKTKVMRTNTPTGAVSESGAFPCGVCGKGVGSNSILCTKCQKWVHGRCSGTRGSLAKASPTFICRKCRNPTPAPAQQDQARQEGIVVDGEEYGSEEKFCYLGDMLDANGGVESAVTARIRRGWQKFRELSPFLTSKASPPKLKGTVYAACVRTAMTYGSETWALKSVDEERLERAEARMLRWMMGVTLQDRRRTDDLRRALGLDSIGETITRARLRWYGHLQRKDEEEWVRRVQELQVDGRRPPGRPQKTWQDLVSADLRRLRLRPTDAADRDGWRRAIREATSHLGPPRRRTLSRQ